MREPVRSNLGADVGDRVAGDVREIQRLARELEPSEPHARDVEQLSHEHSDAPGLPLEPLELRLERAREILERSVGGALQDLELQQERGDRRPQLVRGDRQELVALAHLVLRLAPEARALLDPLPLGDVAHRRHHARPPVDHEGREADLGRELGAVVAQAGEVQAEPHRAGTRHRVVTGTVHLVHRPEAAGQQHLDRLADELALRPAEQAFGVAVHVDDEPVLVRDHHRVRHRLEQREVHDGGWSRPIAARSPSRCQSSLSPPPGGRVARGTPRLSP